jgi:alpha-amylase
VETRFGSRAELENLISTAHANDVEVIADIVINHNSGGGLQFNPYRGYETYTLFDEEHGNASGMFNRTYEHFHPNEISQSDREAFFAFLETDLDHDVQYVQDWLWNNENSVAKYYSNVMEFDGWRFDYVKGYDPWVIQEWMDAVGGFAVGEYWDGYSPNLEQWVEESGIAAFDFAAFYELEKAFDRNEDMTMLENDMLWKTYPDMAVTFVANHDTEVNEYEDNRIAAEHKLQAYSYILTHPGYPTIFYSDYTNLQFQEEIEQLILIHNTIATGSTEILYADEDEYVMRRNGSGNNPGLILYLSLNGNKRRTVNTNWNSTTLMDYTYNTNYTAQTSSNGIVTIESSSAGYAIYSVMQ